MRGALWAKIFLLTLTAAIVLPSMLPLAPQAASAQAAELPPPYVLVLFDSMAAGTPWEGNVEAMLRVLASLGVRSKLQRAAVVREGELSDYDGVIVMSNRAGEEGRVPPNVARELMGYQGLYLHTGYHMPERFAQQLKLQTAMSGAEQARLTIGPLKEAPLTDSAEPIPYIGAAEGEAIGELEWRGSGVSAPFAVLDSRSGVAYTPSFFEGAAAELAMAYTLQSWLGISEGAGQGKLYLLFHDIYPFSEQALLLAGADGLYEAGIPFIFSVRPVFANTEYPAMRRYLETLKYVQARNGTIFTEAPVVSEAAGMETSPLQTRMEGFIDLLAESRIVPLGIGVDAGRYLRNEDELADGMFFFESAALYRGDHDAYALEHPGSNEAFPGSVLCVEWSELAPYWDDAGFRRLPVNVAIVQGIWQNERELKASLDQWKRSWLLFDDFKNGSHWTRTERHAMHSLNGVLAINGQPIGLNDTIKPVSENYAYKETERKSLQRWFSAQNTIYLAIIGFSLILFGVFLTLGIQLYRRKFMK
ncbi:hypothetical protein [Paenibacillus sp. PL2-23]|uniref:hypothetical protein n=1 Tax=Paenibacillus sp. PL2-23 TaxID=2100729 RepID=UPI0030F63D55